MHRLSLSPAARLAISLLQKQGYSSYLVGGSVRDMLMGRAAGDCDIATSALPCEIKSVFAGYTAVLTGERFGTVVIITEQGKAEITTYRRDYSYSDSRRPDKVLFGGDITADLARRDFTVNAIAYNEENGIIDPFDGRADLEAGILRAVGQAGVRFREDALRILRGFRFMATLGFTIEPATLSAMAEASEGLALISGERILAELEKLLAGDNAANALLLMRQNNILPALTCGISKSSAAAIASLGGFIECMAALLYTTRNPQELIATLPFSKKQRNRLAALTFALTAPLPKSAGEVCRLIDKQGFEYAFELCRLAATLFHDDASHNFADILQDIKRTNPCTSIGQLAITGNDLAKLGYKGGQIGEILRQIFYLVTEASLPNNKDALLQYILCKFSQ